MQDDSFHQTNCPFLASSQQEITADANEPNLDPMVVFLSGSLPLEAADRICQTGSVAC